MTQPAPRQPTQQQTAALTRLLSTVMPMAALTAGFATLAAIPRPVAQRLIEQTPAGLMTAALGPAGRHVIQAEATYRAAYLLNAAQRVRESMANGRTLEEALAAEQRFTIAHREAQANRRRAAAAVDKQAAQQRSTVLGWRAKHDGRTSPECADADGKNFSVIDPPAIGYPGAVHPRCRCRPVAAFAGAPMVGQQPSRKVVAA